MTPRTWAIADVTWTFSASDLRLRSNTGTLGVQYVYGRSGSRDAASQATSPNPPMFNNDISRGLTDCLTSELSAANSGPSSDSGSPR